MSSNLKRLLNDVDELDYAAAEQYARRPLQATLTPEVPCPSVQWPSETLKTSREGTKHSGSSLKHSLSSQQPLYGTEPHRDSACDGTTIGHGDIGSLHALHNAPEATNYHVQWHPTPLISPQAGLGASASVSPVGSIRDTGSLGDTGRCYGMVYHFQQTLRLWTELISLTAYEHRCQNSSSDGPSQRSS